MNKAKRMTYIALGLVGILATLALLIFLLHGFDLPH